MSRGKFTLVGVWIVKPAWDQASLWRSDYRAGAAMMWGCPARLGLCHHLMPPLWSLSPPPLLSGTPVSNLPAPTPSLQAQGLGGPISTLRSQAQQGPSSNFSVTPDSSLGGELSPGHPFFPHQHSTLDWSVTSCVHS